MKNIGIIIVASVTALSTGLVQAQVASDNAGNYGSWGSSAGSANQASGGSGFGSWTFANTAGGNNSQNGSFVGGSAGINSGNGNAFGLYANSGQTANAIAPFTEGPMTSYQTFSVEMQNNSIQNGGTVGFGLQNSSGQNVFEFYFVGFNVGGIYDINDWQSAVTGNQIATTVGYTTGPLTLDFKLLPGSAWQFSIYEGNTLEQTLSSATYGNLWSTVSQARLFDFNSGTGGGANVYFNNLEIVPEPSSLVLLGFSGLASLLAMRRRK